MLFGIVLCLVVIGGLVWLADRGSVLGTPIDATPQNITLSGTYVCLPHIDTRGPQTDECAFGLRTDEGDYYAVNFGQSAAAMQQFQAGAHIRASGFFVAKEALNTDQWNRYTMKGIFTVTELPAASAPAGKIDIYAVCQGALAYMTFPDGDAAQKFVAECVDGKHPEVIERFKAGLNAGDGAAI